MGTFAISGAASGLGLATRQRLEADGHRVIGIDLRDVEVVADLSTADGRAAMVAQVGEQSGGELDGVVAAAGITGRTNESGKVLRINYFGAVATLDGLRPFLAHGRGAAAVAISSNAATTQPGGNDPEVVARCLAGEEDAAVECMTGVPQAGYGIAKLALARWVRRRSTTDEWVGAGIRLNAVAPGIFVTPMTEASLAELVARPDWPRPTAEPGRPEELATLVRYLLSPDARYIVGSFIVIDGGTEAALRPDDWPA